MLASMRAVVQRVARAEVEVEGRRVGAIGRGLVALVGVGRADGPAEAAMLAAKLADLRIFPDDEGRMNRSVVDVGGAVLVVSQFTLLGTVTRGRRPSFTGAADPAHAEPLVAAVADRLADRGVEVATGRFRASMEVTLVNEGPVTLVIDVEGGRVV
jgi:D-aminoacyl-tRNA deacylase